MVAPRMDSTHPPSPHEQSTVVLSGDYSLEHIDFPCHSELSNTSLPDSSSCRAESGEPKRKVEGEAPRRPSQFYPGFEELLRIHSSLSSGAGEAAGCVLGVL
jgi:hypothetical protein